MFSSTLGASSSFAILTAGCASSPILPAAPRIEMPSEASRPCSLHRLADRPTLADLEVSYAQRGADLLACDAARRLAVETHAAEHRLEEAARSSKGP